VTPINNPPIDDARNRGKAAVPNNPIFRATGRITDGDFQGNHAANQSMFTFLALVLGACVLLAAGDSGAIFLPTGVAAAVAIPPDRPDLRCRLRDAARRSDAAGPHCPAVGVTQVSTLCR
jgi:hypothetical protein